MMQWYADDLKPLAEGMTQAKKAELARRVSGGE